MTDREQFDNAMSQCGFGRDVAPERRSRVQIAAVVWSVIWATFVTVVLVWSRLA